MHASNKQVRVKYQWKDELRAISASSVSFLHACNALKEDIGFQGRTDISLVLSYEDADGDVVTVSSDYGWRECVSHFQRFVVGGASGGDTNSTYGGAAAAPLPDGASDGSDLSPFNNSLFQHIRENGHTQTFTPSTSPPREAANGGTSPRGVGAATPLKPVRIQLNVEEGGLMFGDGGSSVDLAAPFGAPFPWMKGHVLGRGAYSTVYCGINTENAQLFAVKEVHIGDASEIEKTKREVNFMRHHIHPNVVRYLGCEYSKATLSIMMEYVPGGSLAQLIEHFGPLPPSIVRVFLRQTLCGLQYLHSRRVLHRDIKGGNILVTDKGHVKLSDFGCSKLINKDNLSCKTLTGTALWMAPEIVRNSTYSIGSDLWSLGCTVIEMVTGKPPWTTTETFNSEVQAMFHIATSERHPDIPAHLPTDLKQFLETVFSPQPTDRKTTEDALQLFTEVPMGPSCRTSRRASLSMFSAGNGISPPHSLQNAVRPFVNKEAGSYPSWSSGATPVEEMISVDARGEREGSTYSFPTLPSPTRRSGAGGRRVSVISEVPEDLPLDDSVPVTPVHAVARPSKFEGRNPLS